MATSRIAELASLISRNTAEVENHLLADGLPCPTFDADQPPTLVHNPKIAAARQAILEATDELHALMLGPISIVTLPQVRQLCPRRSDDFGLINNSCQRHITLLSLFKEFIVSSSRPVSQLTRMRHHLRRFPKLRDWMCKRSGDYCAMR